MVFAAWRAAAGFGRRPAPPQLACAFGTIAPVALVLHGSGVSGGGTCVSPAHAPTPGGRAVQVDPMKIMLEAPGTERFKLEFEKLLFILLQFYFLNQLEPLH